MTAHPLPADRSFGRLLAGEVVSNFGSMLSRLVIPWIATLTLDASPLAMGWLLAADVAAGAAAALLLGTLVDRLSQRRVMIAADLGRAAIVGALALAAWRGTVGMPLLVFAAAANGLLTMAFELARSAWIGRHVPGPALPARNAQLSAAGSLTEAGSFAAGGWLYQALGGALSLALDALSYLLSAALLLGLTEKPVARPAAAHAARGAARRLLGDAGAGVALLRGDPRLRTLAQIEVLVALGMGLAGTSYMIYVARDLAFAPGVLGTIFALGGLGAAAGAAVAPALGRRLGGGAAIGLGLALLAAAALLVPLATAASWFAILLLAAHQMAGDGGHVIADVHDRTLRQSAAPPAALARVDAGIRTLGQAASLAGALGGGAVATAIGARAALFASALLFAAAALLALRRLAGAPASGQRCG